MIEKFWVKMTEIYADRFTSRHGLTPADAWKAELEQIPVRSIAHGLKKLKTTHPAWPPSLYEFIALCKPTAIDLGLPDFETCYQAACKSDWGHPFVFHVAKKIGTHNLRVRAESWSRPRFEKAFDEGVQDVINGIKLEDRQVDAKMLQSPPKPSTKETAAKNIAEMRSKIKSKGVS